MIGAVSTAPHAVAAAAHRGRAAHRYIWGLAAVGACTVIAAAGQSILQAAAFALILPLAILVVAVRFGRGPAIVASIAGVFACDFVIVPPAMAFAMPNLKDGLTLAVMTAVAGAISVMIDRLRKQVLVAERHAGLEGLRNTILSALSHDLRTPLAALVSASTALNENAVDAPIRPQLLRMVASEANRLNRVVSALFDLTRLQGRVPSHEHELQSIEELIGSALARLAPQLAGRSVHADVPDETPLLVCDPVLIEQVLVNLVENAVRYSGPGSPIEVTAWARNGEMLVQVADRGPGVPPGDEERVFQKHYHASGDGGCDGLGLGLTICRVIVSAHGGRISLQNRAGGGAKVSMALPLGGKTFEGVAP